MEQFQQVQSCSFGYQSLAIFTFCLIFIIIITIVCVSMSYSRDSWNGMAEGVTEEHGMADLFQQLIEGAS